jgi:uncharacterized protein with HEPN domain
VKASSTSNQYDPEIVADIKEAIRRISLYVAGMNYKAFLQDVKTQDAVLRNLEVIGEASKNLSPQLKQAHPEIPWRSMAATRDRLIHHYFGVNFDIIWQIVTAELPKVLAQLAALDLNDDQESGTQK